MKYFPIRDESIALAAIECGCKLAPKEFGAGPLVNVYTPDFMRGIGYLPKKTPDGKGSSLEEFEQAVIAARWKRRGSITYYFVKDDRFLAFRSTWNESTTEHQRFKASGVPFDVPPLRDITTMTREAFVRVQHEKFVRQELPWCVDSTCMYGSAKFEIDPGMEKMAGELIPEKRAAGMEVAKQFGTTTAAGPQWHLGLSNESRQKINDAAGEMLIPMRQGTPEFYRRLFQQ